jgi:hypothetical protein
MSRHLASVTLAAVLLACAAAPSVAAPLDSFQTFATVAAVKAWSEKSFFGGTRTELFSNEGSELLVVNGMPTSGLLTSQLIFFGRSAPNHPYRMILGTGVIQGDARATKDGHGISVSVDGRVLLVVPFDFVSFVASAPKALPPSPPSQTEGASRHR